MEVFNNHAGSGFCADGHKMKINKILIIGCGGSGKTTLAKQLAQITQLPLIHLDQHYWLPQWEAPTASDWEHKVRVLCEQEAWIMDGNYFNTLDIRIPYSDAVIYMDATRYQCLWRIIKRRLIHLFARRHDLPEHCSEQLSWKFICYVWKFAKERREKILAKLKSYENTKNIVIMNGK